MQLRAKIADLAPHSTNSAHHALSTIGMQPQQRLLSVLRAIAAGQAVWSSSAPSASPLLRMVEEDDVICWTDRVLQKIEDTFSQVRLWMHHMGRFLRDTPRVSGRSGIRPCKQTLTVARLSTLLCLSSVCLCHRAQVQSPTPLLPRFPPAANCAVAQLFDHVLQACPLHVLAYMLATCVPCHLHLPQVCAALLARMLQGGFSQGSQRGAVPQQQPHVAAPVSAGPAVPVAAVAGPAA